MTVDREPVRQRIAELLRDLRGTPRDSAALLAFLRAKKADFDALFHDLVSAGDRHPAVGRLGAALLKVEALEQSGSGDAAVNAAWSALETALADYLGEKAEPSSSRREGFWK